MKSGCSVKVTLGMSWSGITSGAVMLASGCGGWSSVSMGLTDGGGMTLSSLPPALGALVIMDCADKQTSNADKDVEDGLSISHRP